MASVTQNFNDGTVSTTDNGLDVAISDNGFFRLVDGSGAVYYSRNGEFSLNADRQLVNSSGYVVTGYAASGNPATIQQGADPVALTIPSQGLSASATTSGSMVMSLTSSATSVGTTAFDPDDSSTYSFSQPLTTYDSLGNPHNVSLYFAKTEDNTWEVYSVDNSNGDGTVNDVGTLNFDTNGQLTGTDTFSINMAALNGAPAQTFNLSFEGTRQQYASSSVSSQTQDGYSAGDLTSYTINDDGTISGTYSNGKTQLLGQIVLANFANPQGLQSDGNNLWSATSGQAIVGPAGSGTLTSGALESSNVDLSQELVNMIVAQRNYQSNAQTIKTQDAILQTLVSLR